jgi:hypothetical protein
MEGMQMAYTVPDITPLVEKCNHDCEIFFFIGDMNEKITAAVKEREKPLPVYGYLTDKYTDAALDEFIRLNIPPAVGKDTDEYNKRVGELLDSFYDHNSEPKNAFNAGFIYDTFYAIYIKNENEKKQLIHEDTYFNEYKNEYNQKYAEEHDRLYSPTYEKLAADPEYTPKTAEAEAEEYAKATVDRESIDKYAKAEADKQAKEAVKQFHTLLDGKLAALLGDAYEKF